MRYAITHGHRHGGPDPVHTGPGIQQIRNLCLPPGITQVVTGTGRRFQETLSILLVEGKLGQPTITSFVNSPLCGGAEGYDDPNIILTDGSPINLEREYIGVATAPGFDAWKFVGHFPDGTLFICGGELMQALGEKSPSKGALYELSAWDPPRMIKRIQQG